MNYYISDLHIGHKNVCGEGKNFDNRPFKSLEEMHRVFKENWNSRVTNADDVYILGDLCWKVNDETISYITTLKGKKHLILGNHDRIKDIRYKQLFVEIVDYKEITDTYNNVQYHLILSHSPISFWKNQHRLKNNQPVNIHLYGHVHNTIEEKIYQDFIKSLNEKYEIKCIAKNVGCMMDYMNYTPKTIKEILGIERAIV